MDTQKITVQSTEVQVICILVEKLVLGPPKWAKGILLNSGCHFYLICHQETGEKGSIHNQKTLAEVNFN